MAKDVRFLKRDAFLSQYGELYAKLFVGWSREASPFRNTEWDQVLVPHEAGYFDDDIFDAFGTAIATSGDRGIIMTVADTIPPHPISALVAWNRESVGSAHRDSDICVLDYAIFGLSGKWAAMSYHSELTRVTGESLFLDAFTKALGGREAVTHRFFEFQASHWDAPKEVQEKILASVRWTAQSRK